MKKTFFVGGQSEKMARLLSFASFPFFPLPLFPLCTYLLLLLLAPLTACAADNKNDKKVVIPFDFVSKFDDGHYGQMMGDMLWKKLSRQGGFILPESMLDVRDYCTSHHIQPSAEMELAKMKKIVEDDFGAQIGIWGNIERAPGAEAEIYDLSIKCVDFSAQPNPKVVYEVKTRTNSVAEIPHRYVKDMFDALYERPPAAAEGPNPAAEENWKNGPNLVIGDFEHGSGGVPKGWSKVCGQQREPLGGLVRWMAEQGNPSNKIIRFTLDQNVAENEGVMYYSDYFPVEEHAKYRFQCRWRADGPEVKVFIKCYEEIGTPYRSPSGGTEARPSPGKTPGKNAYISDTGQRREVYRSQQNLKGPNGAWHTHTEDFTPNHPRYSPKWGRVMLYAYHYPGVVDFDDVIVKQIVAASPGDQKKVRRPSSESNVTDEEIEANQRRSREGRNKEQ